MILRLILLTIFAGLTALLINQRLAFWIEDEPIGRRVWPSASVAPRVESGDPGQIVRRNLFNSKPPPIVVTPVASEFVEQVEPNRFRVSRQLFDINRLDHCWHCKGVRVTPVYRDRKAIGGYQMINVRPRSVYAQLGLQERDILTAINGVRVGAINQALDLYERLKDSSPIVVTIERGMRSVTITYDMVD